LPDALRDRGRGAAAVASRLTRSGERGAAAPGRAHAVTALGIRPAYRVRRPATRAVRSTTEAAAARGDARAGAAEGRAAARRFAS